MRCGAKQSADGRDCWPRLLVGKADGRARDGVREWRLRKGDGIEARKLA